MKDFYFVSTMDNKITRVTAVDEDDAWRRFIGYYFSHRQSQFKESLAETREDLEHYTYVVPADEIRHIGAL